MVKEESEMGGEKGRIVKEKREEMKVKIKNYMKRERIEEKRDSVVLRKNVKKVMERLNRVKEKLNKNLNI